MLSACAKPPSSCPSEIVSNWTDSDDRGLHSVEDEDCGGECNFNPF
jgi:hypothetical protein